MFNRSDKFNKGDVIPERIIPLEGSIKEIRIDSILESKVVYEEGHWKPACRWPNCRVKVPLNDIHQLCPEHIKKNNLVDGEIIYRFRLIGDKMKDEKYKWSVARNEFILLCSVRFCKKAASCTGVRTNPEQYFKCKDHIKNTNETFSGLLNLSQMYNELRQEFMIKRT